MDPSLIETMQSIIVFCTLVTGLSAVVNVFSAIRQKAKLPEIVQNDRLDRLEHRVDSDKKRIEVLENNSRLVDGMVEKLAEQTSEMRNELDNQKARTAAVERGERVTQHAILAIIDYLANVDDGQDKTRIRQARESLHDYLVGK